MQDFRDIAKKYIANGMWVIPVTSQKQPAISNWKDLQTRPMTEEEVEKNFKRCHGIALLMGGSPRLFAIDFDMKYSLDPILYDRIKEKVPKDLLKKTYVQASKNLGWHWVFKAPESRLKGNEKYANRYTTAAEKNEVYQLYYSDPKTRDIAIKTAFNHKSLVLLESRSGSKDRCGGYILIPPTPGYSYVYGKINEITEEEYDLLDTIMRSFNEVKELAKVDSKLYDNFEWKLNPWEDFNDRGDVIELLQESGWTIITENIKNVRFKRPGATSGSSGLYDKESGIFSCFSTSTCFDTTKSYNHSGVFAELNHDGDLSETYKELINLGYGIK